MSNGMRRDVPFRQIGEGAAGRMHGLRQSQSHIGSRHYLAIAIGEQGGGCLELRIPPQPGPRCLDRRAPEGDAALLD